MTHYELYGPPRVGDVWLRSMERITVLAEYMSALWVAIDRDVNSLNSVDKEWFGDCTLISRNGRTLAGEWWTGEEYFKVLGGNIDQFTAVWSENYKDPNTAQRRTEFQYSDNDPEWTAVGPYLLHLPPHDMRLRLTADGLLPEVPAKEELEWGVCDKCGRRLALIKGFYACPHCKPEPKPKIVRREIMTHDNGQRCVRMYEHDTAQIELSDVSVCRLAELGQLHGYVYELPDKGTVVLETPMEFWDVGRNCPCYMPTPEMLQSGEVIRLLPVAVMVEE